jgi:hypothetical protein
MRNDEARDRIERVRGYRVRGVGSVLSGVLGREMGRLQRAASRSGEADAAWDELAPMEVRRGCRVVGCVKGELRVRAIGAARFALDRWLKSGGAAALRARGVRVRVVR